MKLVGILIIVLSAGSMGFRIAASLKKRCQLLRQLSSALQVLKNEISFCGTPLPQAFALMAVSVQDAPERVFSSVARQMEQRRWLTPQHAMEQALTEQPELGWDVDTADLLLKLAAGLGKYDRDSQMQTIERVGAELECLLQAAEQERSIRSRTYKTLGICAGLAVGILLI